MENYQEDSNSNIDDENREHDSSCFTHVSFDNSNDAFIPQNFVNISKNGSNVDSCTSSQSIYQNVKQEEPYSIGYTSL